MTNTFRGESAGGAGAGDRRVPAAAARQRVSAARRTVATHGLGQSGLQRRLAEAVRAGHDQGRQGFKGVAELPFTPWGEAEWKTYDAADGDYTGACLPFGMTRSINTPEPMQFMQSDTYFAFLFEQNSWFTVVPIDGRPHRTGIATWFGDSVGHWEGDTLVIDTVNFNGKTRLDTVGHPHSDQLHLMQRFSRPDLGHITYEVIVDDPKTFTKPWKNTRTFTLRPDWEMMEYPARRTTRACGRAASSIPETAVTSS